MQPMIRCFYQYCHRRVSLYFLHYICGKLIIRNAGERWSESFRKENRMKCKKINIVLVILGLVLICSSICCYFINKNKINDSVDVNRKGLELTRSRLYLIEGKQYNLDFQPDQYENGSLYPDQGELQEILRNNPASIPIWRLWTLS